jgi:hypothetical protein
MTDPPMAGRLLGASFVRYNRDSEEWENFGMSVMEHPISVYVNKNEIFGIAKLSPEDRHCCPNHIYLMQGYVAKKGVKFDDGSEPITKLPSKKGYRVTPLSVQRELSGTDAPKYFDKSLKPGPTP